MFYIVISKIAIFVKILTAVIEAKKIKMLKMNVMITISVMIKLMIIVIVAISIINCQYTNIVLIRMLSASTINIRKEIISSRTAVRRTMIYIGKTNQKRISLIRATKRSKLQYVTLRQSKSLLTI